MKRKILCIVLAVALAASCLTLVQAANGDSSTEHVLGGKINAAFDNNGTVRTQWAGKKIASGSAVVTETNTTANTPFKGIDFPDEDGSRSFTFVVCSTATVSVSLGCNWGTYAFKNASGTEKPTGTMRKDGIPANTVIRFSLDVPNRAYWSNDSNNADNQKSASEGNIVDGSGVGFRLNGTKNTTSAIYIKCVGGDSTVTDEEIAKVNENLASLVDLSSKKVSAPFEWNESEGTQRLKKALLGFAGVRYQVSAGTAQGYYKRLIPDLSKVKTTGEDTVTSKIAVYNNSDKAIIMCVYPQINWADLKGYSQERVYLQPKTYHVYTVSFKTHDGKVTNAGGADIALSEKELAYRVDAEFQPDIKSGADNANLQDIDITVMNADSTVYKSYSGGTDVFTAPEGYTEIGKESKATMVMYNGDFEDSTYTKEKISINTARWKIMGGGSLSQEYREVADGKLGKWTLKYTSGNGIYGSVLYNVAPAVARFEATDGIFAGGGAGYYKITFDAKADENATGNYYLKLEADNTGQRVISTAASVKMTTEWQTFENVVEVKQDNLDKYFNTLYAGKNAGQSTMFMRLDGSQGALKNVATTPGTYWIDNVKIEKVEFNAKVEASITLNDSIAWNLYSELVDRVDITFGTKTETVKFENGKAVFSDIGPKKMADEITFKFYQNIGGKEFAKTLTTSVKKYMETVIGGSDEAARDLAIDTLNYGAATQMYDAYNTENPANAGLTDAQKDAYLSAERPASAYKQEGEGIRFKAMSLYLKDKVYIKMYIAKSDYKDGMTVKAGDTVLDNWADSGNYKYVTYGGISANELNNTVTAAVYEGETQVSTTVTYSVGTYASNKWEADSAELAQLVQTLVKYGNSAAAYAK